MLQGVDTTSSQKNSLHQKETRVTWWSQHGARVASSSPIHGQVRQTWRFFGYPILLSTTAPEELDPQEKEEGV